MSVHWSTKAVEQFFVGTTEAVFQSQLGVADPSLTDYLADLLIRLVRAEVLFRRRNTQGRRLEKAVDMINEARLRTGEAQRDAMRHIGDFTLFWSGVYPEALRVLGGTDGTDYFIDYTRYGKEAYYVAARLTGVEEERTKLSGEVLLCLGNQFEMCSYGLREVRREWETPVSRPGSRPVLF